MLIFENFLFMDMLVREPKPLIAALSERVEV